jgi:voltage-dependent potassium channel beta subunit
MEYRRLGRSGVKVSEVALGSWLTYGGYVERSTALECLKTALDEGINFLDTADVYANGEAERLVGEFLSATTRKDVFLGTKCFFPTGEGPNDRGLSRKHVFESCHASLARLQTDYLDLLQCHRYDHDTPLEEVVAAMSDLVRQGKILYWGVSMWSAARIARACAIAEATGGVKPVSNQPCYNMLDRSIEREVIPISDEEGVGQIVFSPLAQGVLTGKYQGSKVPEGSRAARKGGAGKFIKRYLETEPLRFVEKVRPVADRSGVPMAQLALAWCLRLPSVNSVIAGATTPDQVKENARASGVALSQTLLEEIEDALTPE